MSRRARRMVWMKRLRARLDVAYHATAYCAEGLVLHVGDRHGGLDARLATHGYRNWAYLTAANPRSCLLPEADNAKRMRQLRQCLGTGNHIVLAGESIDEAGNWPPEPGLLVLGCSLDLARRMACRFEQNALVHGTAGRPARLIWLAS